MQTAMSTGPIQSILLAVDGSHVALAIAVAVAAGVLARVVAAWLARREAAAIRVVRSVRRLRDAA